MQPNEAAVAYQTSSMNDAGRFVSDRTQLCKRAVINNADTAWYRMCAVSYCCGYLEYKYVFQCYDSCITNMLAPLLYFLFYIIFDTITTINSFNYYVS